MLADTGMRLPANRFGRQTDVIPALLLSACQQLIRHNDVSLERCLC
jgi:hypothetical protein